MQNDTDEPLSPSQINDENSININSHVEPEDVLHNYHQFNQNH